MALAELCAAALADIHDTRLVRLHGSAGRAAVKPSAGSVFCLAFAIARQVSLEANIEERDGQGATPLAHALNGGNVACVELLLGLGANMEAMASQGRIPSSMAQSSRVMRPCAARSFEHRRSGSAGS